VSAAPAHLCRLYFVVVADAYEREKILREIALFFPSFAKTSIPPEKLSFSSVMAPLIQPNLFQQEPLLLLENIEKISSEALPLWQKFFLHPLEYGALLCGAPAPTPLCAVFEKVGVVLDLSGEKPWDREKRLTEDLLLKAEKEGKRLAPDVIPLLWELCGKQAGLLDRELEKIFCYVGDRLHVERSDVFRISSSVQDHNLWQEAEEWVWENKRRGGALLPFSHFVILLRWQLDLGIRICQLASSSIPQTEWGSYFPKIRPKVLEKRIPQALQWGRPFFSRAWCRLYEMELLAREGGERGEALLDHFRSFLAR
jgi:DNA polymerase III subunit delta